MAVRGYELVARALKREGVDTAFFLMGGPNLGTAKACVKAEIRMIDVRHEQSAALMAQAYARVQSRPGVCMAASGPGVMNLTTGLANALVDCAPVVALGGASPVNQYGQGSFQELDQVAIMRPITKWAERVYDAKRIPEYINQAFRRAMSGKPGPVYLDLPGDLLYEQVEESDVEWPTPWHGSAILPPSASSEAIERAVSILLAAERPVVISGSGVLYSRAARDLHAFVDAAGVPFFTTPQGRGVVPEDHPYFFPTARSTASKEADVVLFVGTRLNYVVSRGRSPRFSASARVIRIDIDFAEIATSDGIELGIVGDAGQVLRQITEALHGKLEPSRFATWRERLNGIEAGKRATQEAKLSSEAVPIHPLRLCKEIRDFIDRDAILVVDGQEILNFGRQSLPSYVPGHRLNSGPFGMMGVGLPFGLGAKAAKPGAQVVVLHGDGSFGLNGMELDTAVRHDLPVLVVISLNGGWTGDPEEEKAGRYLGYTRFDEIARTLGCYGEYVEKPEEIRPALERASAKVMAGQTALVNVVTDWRATAQTADFTPYKT